MRLIVVVLTISIFFISLSFIAAIFSETEVGKKAANFLNATAELLKAQRDFFYLNMESNDVLSIFYAAICDFNCTIIPSDVISKHEINGKSYIFAIDENLITSGDWLIISQKAKKELKNRYKETVEAVFIKKVNGFLIVRWRNRKK